MEQELALIRAMQRGDQEAFAKVLAAYEKQVYNLCLRMTANHEDAADLTQEAFLKVWRGVGNYKFESSFSTWIFRLTSNVCIDFLRSKKRRPTISLTQEEEQDGAAELEVPDAAPLPEEQLLQRLATSGLELDISDERVLKEVCIFADKCDICEEITRLKSHISQFLSAMGERDAVGRKMDFICQEMGREINTIASKAANIDITKLAIALKNELERIREQIQNIE